LGVKNRKKKGLTRKLSQKASGVFFVAGSFHDKVFDDILLHDSEKRKPSIPLGDLYDVTSAARLSSSAKI
jgi:hypothetical protein